MNEYGKNKTDTIPASSFVGTMAANVDNDKMTDAEFREFVRNTLPIVEYDSKCSCGKPGRIRYDNDLKAGYHCDECWNSLLSDARTKSY